MELTRKVFRDKMRVNSEPETQTVQSEHPSHFASRHGWKITDISGYSNFSLNLNTDSE